MATKIKQSKAKKTTPKATEQALEQALKKLDLEQAPAAKRIGRPPRSKAEPLVSKSVRLPQQMFDDLIAYVERESNFTNKISPANTIVRAVGEFLERDRKKQERAKAKN